MRLVESGLNDCEVSRRLGIARSTVRDWRRPTYVSRREWAMENCPRCWEAVRPMRFKPADYSELLALYLGDGYISNHARTQRLRIALDTKYPGIIADCKSLLERCFPTNPVGEVTAHGGTMVFVSLYSRHLACLFPQHGAGLKHQRRLILEPWQARNRTGAYEYLSYQFSNMSADLIRLFVEACTRVGVTTRVNQSRRTGIWDVRINRRGSVALMEEHVGLKSWAHARF
jgi:hypothetical protein